jgi:hypothetical protein
MERVVSSAYRASSGAPPPLNDRRDGSAFEMEPRALALRGLLKGILEGKGGM